MKSQWENVALARTAKQLEEMLNDAGYEVLVTWHEVNEKLMIGCNHTGNVYSINCSASSVKACIQDIFDQGISIIKSLRYNL